MTLHIDPVLLTPVARRIGSRYRAIHDVNPTEPLGLRRAFSFSRSFNPFTAAATEWPSSTCSFSSPVTSQRSVRMKTICVSCVGPPDPLLNSLSDHRARIRRFWASPVSYCNRAPVGFDPLLTSSRTAQCRDTEGGVVFGVVTTPVSSRRATATNQLATVLRNDG